MQLRIPTWYLLALLSALLARSGGAALALPGTLKLYVPRDDDGDDDSDGDDDNDNDNNGNAHNRAGMAASSHALSKGPVAGVVIGCLLILLLFILLGWWCVRRRRARARQQAQAATRAAAAPEMKEHSSTPLLVHHPSNQHPGSMVTSSPTDVVPSPLYLSDSMGRRGTREFRNIARAYDTRPLPNPRVEDTPPQPPPRDDVQSSPTTSPTSPSSPTSPYTAFYASNSSHRRSNAPSAWTHDEFQSDEGSGSGTGLPLLTRGVSQTSRLTTSSTLHEEMTGYQKALEAHHRKESEDAAMREREFGEGTSVPADPPPQYSPAVEM